MSSIYGREYIGRNRLHIGAVDTVRFVFSDPLLRARQKEMSRKAKSVKLDTTKFSNVGPLHKFFIMITQGGELSWCDREYTCKGLVHIMVDEHNGRATRGNYRVRVFDQHASEVLVVNYDADRRSHTMDINVPASDAKQGVEYSDDLRAEFVNIAFQYKVADTIQGSGRQ